MHSAKKGGPAHSSGKRIAKDEELLQLYFKMIAPALERLETYFPKGSSKVAHRDDAFNSLLFLLRAAHFIGSRARMSLSQQTYFASKRGRDLGKRSGAKRATDAAETWKPHALELALGARIQDPTLSQASVAAAVLSSWRLKIPPPKHETVCRFVALKRKLASCRRGGADYSIELVKPRSRTSSTTCSPTLPRSPL